MYVSRINLEINVSSMLLEKLNYLLNRTFLGFWETVNVQGFTPPGSASHGVAIWKDSMFVLAGESYARASFMYVYDFNGKHFFSKYFCKLVLSRKTSLEFSIIT